MLLEVFPAVPCVESWWNEPSSHQLVRGVPQAGYPLDDTAFRSALRTTYSADDGSFAIYGLPPGDYFLRVPWLAERPAGYTVEVAGLYIRKRVTLTAGKTLHVVLQGEEPKK